MEGRKITNMTQPDFSVIIPTFNRSNFLKKAIISVLNQKGVSFELIVSDNCSTDSTQKVVKAFKDKRIRYIRNRKNFGYVYNAHQCFRAASGQYIFTLSDDDFILDEHTLIDVFKVMKKYKVALGRIGSVAYEKSPKFPYRTSILSDNLIILRPGKDKDIILKTIDFDLTFFSGIIFDNSLIDKNKLIRQMGYIYLPASYEAILKHGITFIPKHFIVAHLSLRFWRTYFDIEKFGSFYVEDLFDIVKKYTQTSEYEEYKKRYLLRGIVMLPSYKYFTNTKNYIKILQRHIKLHKRLFINIRFMIYALSSFLPNPIIKAVRDLKVRYSYKLVREELNKYDYFQKIEKLSFK